MVGIAIQILIVAKDSNRSSGNSISGISRNNSSASSSTSLW